MISMRIISSTSEIIMCVWFWQGPSICTHCIGKGMVLEDSVWESAWETAQTRLVVLHVFDILA